MITTFSQPCSLADANKISGQDGIVQLQCCQPLPQLGVNLRLVLAEFLVEVRPVRARLHRKRKHALDKKIVMLLERPIVGLSERVGELFAGVFDIPAEGFFGEFESTSSSNSNSELVLGFAIEARGRGDWTNRWSQRRPPLALRPPSAISLSQRFWRVSDSFGWEVWRSRIFYCKSISYNLSLRCEHPAERAGGKPDTLLGFSNVSEK